jgi:hypothetical protein
MRDYLRRAAHVRTDVMLRDVNGLEADTVAELERVERRAQHQSDTSSSAK